MYLDWQYSVTSGTSGAIAVALGIDDISILPVGNGSGGTTTNPSLTVSASVNPVTAGNSTTLTASNSAGSNPTSSSFTDTCDLSGLGGSATTSLPAAYTVPANTAPTTYSIACTVTDDQNRSGSYTLSLSVSAPPPASSPLRSSTVRIASPSRSAASTASPLSICGPTPPRPLPIR